MSFRKAGTKELRGRIGIYGASGSGKSVGSLRMAQGMGGSIGYIESEEGSADKAKRLPIITSDINVWTLTSFDIKDYTEAINESAKENFSNLIIDSASHAWYELLQENELLAQSQFRGNTWAAWSKSTPKQKNFIRAILNYPGHIIVTMRSKTEWAQSEGSNGRRAPQRIGLTPEQGKGIEYEFDMLIMLNVDHTASIEKDRTGKFQDRRLTIIDEDFGRELGAWLKQGKPIEYATAEQIAKFNEYIKILGEEKKQAVLSGLNDRGIASFDKCTISQASLLNESLKKKVAEAESVTDQLS